MIEEKIKTLDGKTIIRAIPENEVDRRELKRRAKEGDAELVGGFGDEQEDPDVVDELLGF